MRLIESSIRDASRMLPIGARFSRQIALLQPRNRDVAEARRHVAGVRASVARHLRAPVKRVEQIGSFAKGTSILGHSDVDLLLVLAPEHVRWGGTRITSTALLERFRRAITSTYPSTAISRDGQAVAVQFSRTGVSLDVVPAVERGRIGKANAYGVPDGAGGWLTVAPLAELRRFRRANVESKRKLERAVQLLKHWKYCRAQPVQIRSYYMELLLTSSRLAHGPGTYSDILTSAFRMMCLRGASPLRDPDGRVGMTQPVPSRASADRVIAALRAARDRAVAARSFEEAGDIRRAATQWRMLFNGYFP